MKHLAEFMNDNNAPLSSQQELLIMEWLKSIVDLKGSELAFGMQSHIENRLFIEYQAKNKT